MPSRLMTSCPSGQRKVQASRGFTLIELLVVLSIIGVLLALLLPAIAATRDSVNNVSCLSNQRGLMSAWTVAMAENQGEIPYIVGAPGPNSHRRTRWWGLLAEQMPDPEVLLSTQSPEPDNPVLCPEIEMQHDRPAYTALFFGYAVNSRWADCGLQELSQLQSWDAIPAPSEYPWFADPLVRPYPPNYIAVANFGRSDLTNYGLGFYHESDSGNAVFADGHAESYKADVLEETGSCGTPSWILAQKP